MGVQEAGGGLRATLRPVTPIRRKLRFANWGNARDDALDYGRLAQLLGPRLHPVRPVVRRPPHVAGQIPLWGGPP
jgi:hypothetical protein